MTGNDDYRISELKLLEHLADRTWSEGICVPAGSGQAAAIGVPQQLYADLIVTLLEDGYLHTRDADIRRGFGHIARSRDPADREHLVNTIWGSQIYHEMTVTYRGLRRIDELRESLRRDRVLEAFGILLDGRYIVSDLNHFLERLAGEPMSLLLADVDDFKRFNEEQGYKAGDAVLREVFGVIKRLVGDRGEAYRRGGEEIEVLLPYHDLAKSRALAEQIREKTESSTVLYADKQLQVTLSIGVAASPPLNPDGPALEAHAENGLKKAKEDGKNRVTVAS